MLGIHSFFTHIFLCTLSTLLIAFCCRFVFKMGNMIMEVLISFLSHDVTGQVGVLGQLSPVTELDASLGQTGRAAASRRASPWVPSLAQLIPPSPVPHLNPAARHQDDNWTSQGSTTSITVEYCWAVCALFQVPNGHSSYTKVCSTTDQVGLHSHVITTQWLVHSKNSL